MTISFKLEVTYAPEGEELEVTHRLCDEKMHIVRLGQGAQDHLTSWPEGRSHVMTVRTVKVETEKPEGEEQHNEYS